MSNSFIVCIAMTQVETKVIATVAEVDECLNRLLSTIYSTSLSARRVVGLSIEKQFGHNTSIRDTRMSERVVLLKLCHYNICLIIQLHLMRPLPPSLSGFLHHPGLSFVGIGIHHSLEALERDYGLKCRNPVDLAHLAATAIKDDKLRAYGLFDLAHRLSILGMTGEDLRMANLFHFQALSDWGATPLSSDQIAAATWNCFMSFYLGNRLLDGLLPGESVSGIKLT